MRSVRPEQSPYRKEIQNGAERRNELIHPAKPVELETQHVIDYVRTIESALRHLLQQQHERKSTHRSPAGESG
jgi:hypothetical protein